MRESPEKSNRIMRVACEDMRGGKITKPSSQNISIFPVQSRVRSDWTEVWGRGVSTPRLHLGLSPESVSLCWWGGLAVQCRTGQDWPVSMSASEDTRRQYKTFGHQVLGEPDTAWSSKGLRASLDGLVSHGVAGCQVVWGLCCPCWEHQGTSMVRVITANLLISSRNNSDQDLPDILMLVLIVKIKI